MSKMFHQKLSVFVNQVTNKINAIRGMYLVFFIVYNTSQKPDHKVIALYLICEILVSIIWEWFVQFLVI